MNKKISIAVGVAAAVAFTGTAMANNTQTINTSEAYVNVGVAAAFVPEFVTADCTAAIGSTGNCNDHGAVAAGNAAGTTIIFTNAPGGTEANGGYFNNGDMMPVLTLDVWSGGIQHAAWKNDPPFSSGLMSWDRSDGSSYFAGLQISWTGYSDAAAGHSEFPMGAPILPGGAESVREEWVDQTIVGYVESLDGSGNSNYDQNFRSQLSWIGTGLGVGSEATTYAHIDQRLEQDLTLDDNGLAFEASRQTLQTAFALNSNTGYSTDPEGGAAGGSGIEGAIDADPAGFTGTSGIGQLVTQDIEGWFYSCLNCDSSLNSVSHAFTPFETSLTFMPYTNTWRDLPSISHGASGGNLSSYASAPGQPGP
jgi:hypothetical protein